MTTLKQGDLIKNENGDMCNILGVCGEVVHISFSNNHSFHDEAYTEFQLKDMGYTWDIPAWEPENYEMYWFISSIGVIGISKWTGDTDDHGRKNFQGVYQTEALAEAALLEIKRKPGKQYEELYWMQTRKGVE